MGGKARETFFCWNAAHGSASQIENARRLAEIIAARRPKPFSTQHASSASATEAPEPRKEECSNVGSRTKDRETAFVWNAAHGRAAQQRVTRRLAKILRAAQANVDASVEEPRVRKDDGKVASEKVSEEHKPSGDDE